MTSKSGGVGHQKPFRGAPEKPVHGLQVFKGNESGLRMFIPNQPYAVRKRMCILPDCIAVTNPWTDKRTPNMPSAFPPFTGWPISSIRKSRPHSDGAHMTETNARIKTSYVNCTF